jgi:ribosomal protein S18 acetylase RimI-like enzyme
MATLAGVTIGAARSGEIPILAGLAARGMRDNPSSLAFYGSDPVRRVARLGVLYHWMLASSGSRILVARRRDVPVGVVAISPPGACFSRQAVEKQREFSFAGRKISIGVPTVPVALIVPLLRQGPAALSRLSAWAEAGLAHDPDEPHEHLELVVVEAALQGLGIGTQMMEVVCRDLDAANHAAYLETDTDTDVRFYTRFGFTVIGEAEMIGIRARYMWRDPAEPSAPTTVG